MKVYLHVKPGQKLLTPKFLSNTIIFKALADRHGRTCFSTFFDFQQKISNRILTNHHVMTKRCQDLFNRDNTLQFCSSHNDV